MTHCLAALLREAGMDQTLGEELMVENLLLAVRLLTCCPL